MSITRPYGLGLDTHIKAEDEPADVVTYAPIASVIIITRSKAVKRVFITIAK